MLCYYRQASCLWIYVLTVFAPFLLSSVSHRSDTSAGSAVACREGKGTWQCCAVFCEQGSELVSGASQQPVTHRCDLDVNGPSTTPANKTSNSNICGNEILFLSITPLCLHLPHSGQPNLLCSSLCLFKFAQASRGITFSVLYLCYLSN